MTTAPYHTFHPHAFLISPTTTTLKPAYRKAGAFRTHPDDHLATTIRPLNMLEFTTAEGKEIALHGLSPSMEIGLHRSMMAAGHMHPTATAKVQEALKATAKLVYNQQKFTDEYHPRVSEPSPCSSITYSLIWLRSASARTPSHISSAPSIARTRHRSRSTIAQMPASTQLLRSLQKRRSQPVQSSHQAILFANLSVSTISTAIISRQRASRSGLAPPASCRNYTSLTCYHYLTGTASGMRWWQRSSSCMKI